MIAPTCPHCGKPVDQGRHTKIGSGGGQDESGARYVETRWRCEESTPTKCAGCGGIAHYRATPQKDLFFCTYACASDYAEKKAVRFSVFPFDGRERRPMFQEQSNGYTVDWVR
jgi:hypothetical protein